MDKPDLILERALLSNESLSERRARRRGRRSNASLRNTLMDVGRLIMGRRRSERRRWLELVRRCFHL